MSNQISFPYSKPLGKNSVSSTYVLFEDRAYYRQVIIPALAANYGFIPFGDLIQSNALYGLINNNLDVIVPDTSYFSNIPSSNKEEKLVMNFVADAFNEMNEYLATAASIGKLSKNSPYVKLKAHKTYLSPQLTVDVTKNKLMKLFEQNVNSNMSMSSAIIDEKTFNKKYALFLKKNINNDLMITKSAIVLSTNFFNFASGLVIDIAKDKADNDSIKFEKYLITPDFVCFQDACKRFGFKIDVNVPWRIYADLNSPAMNQKSGNHVGYMARYNIRDVDDLFAKRYSPTFIEELNHLKKMFYDSYTYFFEKNGYYELDYKKLTKCDFNTGVVKKRDLLSREQYYSSFDDLYWLKMYIYFRNYETKKGLNQQQFENLVRESGNFLKVNKYYQSLEFANSFFKQFKDVHYLSSLQPKTNVVEMKAESRSMPDLIF